MIVRSMIVCSLVMVASSCQRGSRQVVFENPCANSKEGASSKNCNKTGSTSGGTGSSDWTPDAGGSGGSSNQTSGGSIPPSTSGGGGAKPPSGTGGSGGTGGLGSNSGTGGSGGTGGLPSGGNGSGGIPSPGTSSSNGTDLTSVAKLAISISKQGIPTLVFNGANQSKFSGMQFTSEATSMVVPDASLKMQGESNVVGPLALKVSLTFKYDSKSCTGSAAAKIEQETPITVKCQ